MTWQVQCLKYHYGPVLRSHIFLFFFSRGDAAGCRDGHLDTWACPYDQDTIGER